MGDMNYKSAGVNIETANETKNKFKDIVSSKGFAHCKPLNRVGAFASLVELGLSDYKEPIFVLKSEEPGSKQLLSIENNRIEWIARDLVNHLVNDIIVMGALPCAVLDTIICGKLEKLTVLKLVGEISKACAENGCVLVGGETSEQPGMLLDGRYILQASVLGIVEKSKIIDGAAMKCGDVLIAMASNGLHTNGYSLVRKLMETKPKILDEKIDDEYFLDSILKPHTSYFGAVRAILEKYPSDVHAMAHITGGSIYDNLVRVMLNDELQANIDLSAIKIPAIFSLIKKYAGMTDENMLNNSPFNNGVGLIAAAQKTKTDEIMEMIKKAGIDAYTIGEISKSGDKKKVLLYNDLKWEK
ncbi:MAG: phosphoribosylformylglycinamidine cyclo-ligase [Oscillospiraceae bacterium]|nr:phosphoribosylformylglycinamidine cyclo-ligase [Oscillospiraceae bacterium]